MLDHLTIVSFKLACARAGSDGYNGGAGISGQGFAGGSGTVTSGEASYGGGDRARAVVQHPRYLRARRRWWRRGWSGCKLQRGEFCHCGSWRCWRDLFPQRPHRDDLRWRRRRVLQLHGHSRWGRRGRWRRSGWFWCQRRRERRQRARRRFWCWRIPLRHKRPLGYGGSGVVIVRFCGKAGARDMPMGAQSMFGSAAICPTLSAPTNGATWTYTKGQQYQSVATTSCNTGFYLASGTLSLTCSGTSAWTGTAPTCTGSA